MADTTNFSFDVQEQRLVIEWRREAEQLNEEAKEVTDLATRDLQTFAQTAVGNFFNEVASLCESVIAGLRQIFAGMQQIIEAVDSFVEKLGQVISDLFAGAHSTRTTIAG